MSATRFVLRGLVGYWRVSLVVVFGLGVATAVITGSLVIGDSMRGSLRDTALSRLGRVSFALDSAGHFRAALADDLRRDPQAGQVIQVVCAVLQVRGAAQDPESEATVPEVTVLGVDADFWKLHNLSAAPSLESRSCAVSASLARDLSLERGSGLLLTVGRRGPIPADSLFARRSRRDATPSLRVEVAAVLPDGGAGDFGLDARTEAPRNVFVSREWLAGELRLQGKANLILVACRPDVPAPGEPLREAVSRVCTLADYALKLKPSLAHGTVSLQSEGPTLTAAQVTAITGSDSHWSRTSVYLATSLRRLGPHGEGRQSGLAYAVVAGLQESAGILPQEPRGDDIYLNAWAAQDLGAKVGDRLELRYLVPTPAGDYPEKARTFTLRGIVPLQGSAADPDLVPDFEGITDARRMGDWEPPFPVNLSRVTKRDEDYWSKHRATPKAFASLDAVRLMWQSGTGGAGRDWVTSLRYRVPPRADMDEEMKRLEASILGALPPEAGGLSFRPVRELALAAAQGSSDFGQLFLGLSMFLVAAGAALAGVVLRLSADQRAPQVGLMVACGFAPRRAAHLLFAEGAILALLGALVGLPLGGLYAAGIVYALTTWWQGALGDTPSLWLHATPMGLVGGGLSGLLIGLIAAAWSTRRLGRLPALALLAGTQAMAVTPVVGASRRPTVLLVASLALAVVLAVLSVAVHAVAPEVAFFGIGSCLLVLGLSACSVLLQRQAGVAAGFGLRAVPSRDREQIGEQRRRRLKRAATTTTATTTTTTTAATTATTRRSSLRSCAVTSLPHLALRNAAASPARSLLVVGLLAMAVFVIVAVAANTRDLSRLDTTRKDSGTGGFALLATSSVPLTYDLGSPAGRSRLGFAPEDEAVFAGTEIVSFFVSPGADISCLNLAKPVGPRFLGVPEAMLRRGGFQVTVAKRAMPAEAVADAASNGWTPWQLLEHGETGSAAFIPAFGDAASVRWTLHSGLGRVYPPTDRGLPGPHVVFVGLLQGSIFQRELLVSERRFRELWPSVTGPSYFLIAAPPERERQVAEALRRNLGDLGLQVRSTREVLAGFMRVQNTYLVMFLALGGLGLLLGTVGMAAVLLRSAFERRSELALLLALGFTRARVAALLMAENVGLLLVGVVLGVSSALVAVGPELASVQAQVNWAALMGVLGGVLLVGAATCALAVQGSVRGTLISALRRE